jgi:uncharacterized protein YegP (UPF0339 family)
MYKDAKGEYRWRLIAANGRVVATSGEGYVAKEGARNGIEAVIRDAAAAPVIEV